MTSAAIARAPVAACSRQSHICLRSSIEHAQAPMQSSWLPAPPAAPCNPTSTVIRWAAISPVASTATLKPPPDLASMFDAIVHTSVTNMMTQAGHTANGVCLQYVCI